MTRRSSPAGAAEDMVMDFGPSLGIWLLPQDSLTDWHQITTDGADRLKAVRLGSGNPGVVIDSNSVAGLTYWSYSGYPGTRVTINASYYLSIRVLRAVRLHRRRRHQRR